MYLNNNNKTSGRLCNHFFRNLAASFIAKKIDLKFTYSYLDEFNKLGLILYEGNQKYSKNVVLNELNYMKYYNGEKDNKCNYDLCSAYFQTPEIANLIRSYVNEKEQQEKIIANNPYNSRYNNNNDVFIHIRLGDVKQFAQPFEYYDNILSELQFDKGYIASDTITDIICKKLINKYNLEPVNKSEIETIQFGTTCKNVIISTGSFSWTIGVLSFFSKVYFPKIKHWWHGDIFIFPDWIQRNW